MQKRDAKKGRSHLIYAMQKRQFSFNCCVLHVTDQVGCCPVDRGSGLEAATTAGAGATDGIPK